MPFPDSSSLVTNLGSPSKNISLWTSFWTSVKRVSFIFGRTNFPLANPLSCLSRDIASRDHCWLLYTFHNPGRPRYVPPNEKESEKHPPPPPSSCSISHHQYWQVTGHLQVTRNMHWKRGSSGNECFKEIMALAARQSQRGPSGIPPSPRSDLGMLGEAAYFSFGEWQMVLTWNFSGIRQGSPATYWWECSLPVTHLLNPRLPSIHMLPHCQGLSQPF